MLAQPKDADRLAVRNEALHRSTLDELPARPRKGIWAWVAALVLYSLIVPTGFAPQRIALFITDIGWTVAAILASVSSFRAARALAGHDRAAWLLFGTAIAAWAGGQVVWDVYELILGIEAPFPSAADIGYFSFGALMIAGVWQLRSTQRTRKLTWLRAANLGLVFCSFAVLLIVMLTRPFMRSTYQLGPALIIAAESAAVTIACVIAVYILWSYSWGSRLSSTALATAALAAHTMAMLFYTRELVVAQYGVNSPFNIAWLLAFALQQWAAESRLSSARGADDSSLLAMRARQGWVEALIPAALLLCVAVCAVTFANEFTTQMIYFASLMLAAFAIVSALRESLLHWRGQQTQAKLERATAALSTAAAQFQALDARRAELEREIEVTSRAGGVGLWEWDMKSAVVHFSREWKHQLGYAEHEIADDIEEWRSRLHPDDFDRMTRAVAEFAASPQGEFIEEQRLRHRDGSYRWILVHGTVAADVHGKPLRLLGSHIDITDRKMVELSLRQSEARYRDLVNELETRVAKRTSELTEAYRESQSFAYAVAHDLKAPLRAIDGFSYLLDQSASARLSTEEQGLIKRVRRGAIHMASLIDGLLDYSRLEHRELRFCAIDCRELIEDVLQSMEGAIHASTASVAVTVAPGRVHADVDGLRIVIRNLLDNALKFASAARTPQVEIGSYEEPGCIVLTIRDNGIGFDPQYHDRIFEIFNRLHSTGYEGTGIGLALVRKAVHRMHGRIWAQSALDRGATFFVRLPAAIQEQAGHESR